MIDRPQAAGHAPLAAHVRHAMFSERTPPGRNSYGNQSMLNVLVESTSDADIVRGLIDRVRERNSANVEFRVDFWKGALHPRRSQDKINLYLDKNNIRSLVVVFDQESGTVADQPQNLPLHRAIKWCPAIPEIEAWLFADEIALERFAPASTKDVINRLPSPENIPYPKSLKHYLLRQLGSVHGIIKEMDLDRSAARSPSLGYFLRTIEHEIGLTTTFDSADIGGRQIDRDIMKGLISEIYPGSSSIFRTSTGVSISADQMMQEITSGSALGRTYSTEILRVARDLLQRQAQRQSGKIG